MSSPKNGCESRFFFFFFKSSFVLTFEVGLIMEKDSKVGLPCKC